MDGIVFPTDSVVLQMIYDFELPGQGEIAL